MVRGWKEGEERGRGFGRGRGGVGRERGWDRGEGVVESWYKYPVWL